MGEESWHHVAARTKASGVPSDQEEHPLVILNKDNGLSAQLWALQYIEKAADFEPELEAPEFFLSKSECIESLWAYVRVRMFELALWELMFDSMGDDDYEFITDDKSVIKEIQGEVVKRFSEILDDDSQWDSFEKETLDRCRDEIKEEIIQYYFGFIDGDGVTASYSIYPVTVTKPQN